MDLKELILRTVGAGIMGLAFIGFFIALLMTLAPYEFERLYEKVSAEIPDKLILMMDSNIPELKNISFDDVKLFCTMRSAFNISDAFLAGVSGYQIEKKDIDFACARINSISNINELKKLFITSKLAEFRDKIKNETIIPFLTAYTPIAFTVFFILYLISAFILYLSKFEIISGLRTIALHTLLYLIFYIIAFGICWYTLSSIVDSVITQNVQLTEALSKLPEQQKQIIEDLILEVRLILTEWMREVMIYLIIIYCILAIISGIAWISCGIVYKAEYEEKK
ncbi:MAG: hypothetical protein AB1391_01315 [Candidatus Micrarchaeota archaeon]